MPALWRPTVKAAKDKEGLLKVNRIRSITGEGIKRNKNAKIFIKILEVLLLKIPITNGGKLITITGKKNYLIQQIILTNQVKLFLILPFINSPTIAMEL